MEIFQSKNGVSVAAYQGDAMTLLAFDLGPERRTEFTGFSIRITPLGKKPYYMFNNYGYPAGITYPPAGTVMTPNLLTTEFSPIQKFRWIHVPSTYHHIESTVYGIYQYDITPRYLSAGALEPIDPSLTVSLSLPVNPFKSKSLSVGFTRSFVASQAYANHFGDSVKLRPDKSTLIFNTKLNSGTANPAAPGLAGQAYSYEDIHQWLGWQARARVIEFLEDALKDPKISLDVFAFDLDEPVICDHLLTMADEGRIRVVLDDSKSHKGLNGEGKPQFEDQFTTLFKAKTQGKPDAGIVRGKFGALAHSKVLIQKKDGAALKVLTGSTNFSTNGLYINANHVLIFDNTSVASLYERIFEAAYTDMAGFKDTAALASASFGFNSPAQADNVNDPAVPEMIIRFAPHPKTFAFDQLTEMAAQVDKADSILFAIMDDDSDSPLLTAIKAQVESDKTFTYGITDTSDEVLLYSPGSTKGIHATGKGLNQVLPFPFKPEPGIQGISIHHKFVVLNFNTNNGVVFCGSSNLALGPEQRNGDNLLEIRDPDVVTAFAIEAIRLVDHFQFRDKDNKASQPGAKKLELHTTSDWVEPYFDPADMHSRERDLLVRDQPSF
ncbi:phospholipase D-like domain-containing protein [Mucilaginibacter sp. KACC 22773]|uniref:phospholipase D-like domain-containing protein n=1 Tax=Mucilaginibacter sp. KACC 22773 TaxID=3025671 RepID=UPI00236566E6|nr:phospholipase D-like domain-containing protein [Mucilaginibacter sp. KACC 22773]WDF76997.1 phospholipase D-like domain-containing protein [Mucilaginibacter sp. KACC 22773]